jgi:hypothetical protein
MELKSVINKTLKKYPKDNELMVEFYTDIPMGVADSFTNQNMSDVEKMVLFVKNIVADWNFADVDGSKLEINEVNIRRLGTELVTWIVEEATLIVKPDDNKKKE